MPSYIKSHDRSPDQTMLGVSMTKELKNRIKKVAEYEGRSMASFAAYHLKQAVEDLEREQRLTALNTPPPAREVK